MSRKLDYVVSGTSYMRFSNPGIAKDETNSQIINMLLDKLVTGVHSHKFLCFTTDIQSLVLEKDS